MKRDLKSYHQQYQASPFEETMARLRKDVILNFLRQHRCQDILEVGCGNQPLFRMLDHFQSYTVVEPCMGFFRRAQLAARRHVHRKRIELHNVLFEDYAGISNRECVLISGLLHEIAEPERLLGQAWRVTRPGGWLHVNVPNARSFHRLLAVEAGLIASEFNRSATQVRLQQPHTFDLIRLRRLVRRAGFRVVESGSYFIKPFTHAQMQMLVAAGLLTPALIRGLSGMEKHLPGLGAEIYVNAVK